ncbi:MAG: glycosyl hydrolase [Thermoguttaceae bacterium]
MMRTSAFGVVAIGVWLVGSAAMAGQGDLSALERQFRELPTEARRLTGPLFWLHGDETRQQLETEIAKIAEGGNGCFTAESRPHNDWLGPGWWRDLAICLDAAKKHNLQMWIFDERWWPSHEVGGKVPARYAVKRLDAASAEVEGPKEYQANGYAGQRYVAAVAGRVTADGKIDGDSLVDLAPFVHEGKLVWQAPAGKWRVMKFTHVRGQPLAQTGHLSVDGASKDCVDWLIQTVYQPHYDHFGPDFGKTIQGFFYDEPETRGDWGTELDAVLAERGVDWKKAYVAHKFLLAGEEQVAAKFQYLDALADAWGRTLYGGIARWCHEHHVKSIGHFMEHGSLYRSADFCAGDMMRLQRYSDMGALDAICRQFVVGQKTVDKTSPGDEPVWQTPKLASSISHVFGKADDVTMVEIFGARGQDLTYREMKWWTDHMQVSGVNFLIPHSFNPRGPYDNDCPPYFYNGGFEPRWPLYRVWADYTSRLSLMLTGGRHVCPVAILFNGNLGQVGKMIPPEDISTALQDAQIDCDWLPMDVFEREATIDGSAIKLHGEQYRVLIVPPAEVIPYATMAKAKEFFENGGTVIGYKFLPSKSATVGKSNAEIAAVRDSIWGSWLQGVKSSMPAAVTSRSAAGGLACFNSEAAEVCAKISDDHVRPLLADRWLHVLHRQKAGRDVLLVANQNHQGGPRQYTFRVTVPGEPECWDPMRNELTTPQLRRIDANTTEVSLTLEPLESVLLVFQPKKTARPLRIEPDTKPIRAAVAIVRDANPPASPPMPDVKRKPLTLSPLKAAEPFRGRVTLPADVDLKKCRVCLEMDNLPDEAAAVTVNGQGAGGLIGRPLRLDITHRIKPGENTILIEPLAPKAARLTFYGNG